jgi:hypothetical protein
MGENEKIELHELDTGIALPISWQDITDFVNIQDGTKIYLTKYEKNKETTIDIDVRESLDEINAKIGNPNIIME